MASQYRNEIINQLMMRLILIRVIALFSMCLVSLGIFAQEKTLQYYNTHESEILPDARESFRRGDYDRTIELCKWHYIISGNNLAASLREKSERCAQLLDEMNELRAEGNIKEAKEKAQAILSINPDDAFAKEVLKIEESVPPIQDTVVVPPPPEVKDTVVVPPPVVKDTVIVPEVIQTADESIPSAASAERLNEPRTRFVVKGGASILDLKQMSQSVAPGGAIGLYDIGGSPIGVEVGGYFCSGLPTSSLFGADASIVARIAKGVYPKIGAGYFTCNPSESSKTSTTGLCAIGGLTFVLGQHFCLEIGAKYYPVINLNGTEMVSTSQGVSYEFPSVDQILPGGIAPFVSVGVAF